MASTETDPNKRYVITGMGTVTALGHDLPTTWGSLIAGKHAVVNIDETVLAEYPRLREHTHLAAPIVGYDLRSDPRFAERLPGANDLKRIHRSAQFMLTAALEAMDQAGMTSPASLAINPKIDPYRVGIRVGTGFGGADETRTTYEEIRIGEESLPGPAPKAGRVPMNRVLEVLPARAAGVVGQQFGLHRTTRGVLAECASGTVAIIEAVEQLKLGKADFMIAGGTEGTQSPGLFALFAAIRAQTKSNGAEDEPRPFASDYSGIVLGEGAGAFVITSLATAINYDMKPLVEIVGYGETQQDEGDTLPSEDGIAIALGDSLEGTDLEWPYVDHHATSTTGDATEMNATRRILPPSRYAGGSSPKGWLSHTLGASGAIETAVGATAVIEGTMPASRNLTDDNRIPETEGYNMIIGEAQRADIDGAVNISAGFSGFNAVVALKRIPDSLI